MTRARRSSPCVNFMWSTAVSIVGKVLSTWSTFTPGANGVYFFGSNVSVCAMPPAIQSTITASAVAAGAASCCAARRVCGSRPTSAPSVAAAVAPMNPRRLMRALMNVSSRVIVASVDQLEFWLHQNGPQQIGNTGSRQPAVMRRILDCILRNGALFGRRRARQRIPENPIHDRRGGGQR